MTCFLQGCWEDKVTRKILGLFEYTEQGSCLQGSVIKYLSGTEQMILGWYTRINPVLFYKLLRTVCTSRMTRDMLYLQCCPTDTRQREEVSFLSAIKNKKKPPVFALLRASFFLSTWTCYFFSPTGIIAYADQEINMQVILKHSETNKKE